MFPASQLSGLSGAGAESSAMIARQAPCKLHAGDHSFLRMSRQISPVCSERAARDHISGRLSLYPGARRRTLKCTFG